MPKFVCRHKSPVSIFCLRARAVLSKEGFFLFRYGKKQHRYHHGERFHWARHVQPFLATRVFRRDIALSLVKVSLEKLRRIPNIVCCFAKLLLLRGFENFE